MMVSPERRAFHEAGHAIVAAGSGLDLLQVSAEPGAAHVWIRPPTGWVPLAGLAATVRSGIPPHWWRPADSVDPRQRDAIAPYVRYLLAGSLAERLRFGEHDVYGGEDDLLQASELIALLGLPEGHAEAYADRLLGQAQRLLIARQHAVAAVAGALLLRETSTRR
jgi:hypothetical protein